MSENPQEYWTSLARAKAENVLEIIDASVIGGSGGIDGNKFDINDARWCIKLLAEAIAAGLPDTAYPGSD